MTTKNFWNPPDRILSMTDDTFETFDVFECLGWAWLSTGILWQSYDIEITGSLTKWDEKIPYLNDLTEHLDVQQNISNA